MAYNIKHLEKATSSWLNMETYRSSQTTYGKDGSSHKHMKWDMGAYGSKHKNMKEKI